MLQFRPIQQFQTKKRFYSKYVNRVDIVSQYAPALRAVRGNNATSALFNPAAASSVINNDLVINKIRTIFGNERDIKIYVTGWQVSVYFNNRSLVQGLLNLQQDTITKTYIMAVSTPEDSTYDDVLNGKVCLKRAHWDFRVTIARHNCDTEGLQKFAKWAVKNPKVKALSSLKWFAEHPILTGWGFVTCYVDKETTLTMMKLMIGPGIVKIEPIVNA